jgi:hypothetical protein
VKKRDIQFQLDLDGQEDERCPLTKVLILSDLQAAGKYDSLGNNCSRVFEEPRERLVWESDT